MSKHESNKRMAEAASFVDVEFVGHGGCRGMVVGSSVAPGPGVQGVPEGGRRGGRAPDAGMPDEAGTSRGRGDGGRRHGGGSSSDGD